MSAPLYIRFGPVIARVSAEQSAESVHSVLRRWFPVVQLDLEDLVDVDLTLSADAQARQLTQSPFSSTGPARHSGASVRLWDGKAWEGWLESEDASRQTWRFDSRDGAMLRPARLVPTTFFRLLHVHYFSPDEVRASTFLYRHLLPVVQACLLRREATFVHASSLGHISGGALLISGWGGAGKSTSCAALAYKDPEAWSYLSDDLAIADASGRIHYCPFPVNLFPYSVRGLAPAQKHLQSAMGGLSRLQWVVRRKILGDRGVARRLPPPPSRGPESQPLALAINLVRSSDPRPRTEEVDSARLARACASVMTYEMRQSLPMITAAAASPLGDTSALPPPHETGLAIEKVLRAAFAGIRAVSLSVPQSLPPDMLGQLVCSLWEPEGRM